MGKFEKVKQKLRRTLKKLLESQNIFVATTPMASYEFLASEINRRLISHTAGVLHIGGHRGQESRYYDTLDTKVIWIEADPDTFNSLISNVSIFPSQRAVCALLGEEDGISVNFLRANNDGQSSSVFEFGSDLGFEALKMSSTIKLTMNRLDSLFTPSDLIGYQHWVVDAQGSELMILKGAGDLLDACMTLDVEVSTREVYAGGTKWVDLEKFLTERGFMHMWSPKSGSHENVFFFRYSHLRG